MCASSPSTDRADSETHLGRWPTRYDLLLAAVPLVFCLAVVAEWTLSLPDRTGVVAASLVAAALLSDALFRNPPQRA